VLFDAVGPRLLGDLRAEMPSPLDATGDRYRGLSITVAGRIPSVRIKTFQGSRSVSNRRCSRIPNYPYWWMEAQRTHDRDGTIHERSA